MYIVMHYYHGKNVKLKGNALRWKSCCVVIEESVSNVT